MFGAIRANEMALDASIENEIQNTAAELEMASSYKAPSSVKSKRRKNGRRRPWQETMADVISTGLAAYESFEEARLRVKERGSRLGGATVDETAVGPAPWVHDSLPGPRAAQSPFLFGARPQAPAVPPAADAGAAQRASGGSTRGGGFSLDGVDSQTLLLIGAALALVLFAR